MRRANGGRKVTKVLKKRNYVWSVCLPGALCTRMVAKYKHGAYVSEREQSTWFKIRNPRYQMIGRAELFERDRHRKPVPGWHSCELACARSN